MAQGGRHAMLWKNRVQGFGTVVAVGAGVGTL